MTARAERLQPLYCPACGKEFLIVYRSKKGAIYNECRTRLKPLQLPACVARRRIGQTKKERAARNASSEAAKNKTSTSVYTTPREGVNHGKDQQL